jgi:hypothetical protein
VAAFVDEVAVEHDAQRAAGRVRLVVGGKGLITLRSRLPASLRVKEGGGAIGAEAKSNVNAAGRRQVITRAPLLCGFTRRSYDRQLMQSKHFAVDSPRQKLVSHGGPVPVRQPMQVFRF